MQKSTLFISAVLTTFMLAVMFGVVSAYRGLVNPTQPQPVVAQVQPTVETQPVDQLISLAPALTGVVTPEQATTLAMQMIARTDVYSVESVIYEGAPAYLVTFSSGDLVYVSPTGQILAVTKLEPVVVVAPAPGNNNNSGGQVASSVGGGEREDHDDQEDQEDHDD